MTEFRLARPGDAAALQPLVHRAYRGDSARAGWTHEADLLDGQRIDAADLESLIADPTQAVIVAEASGAAVGCVQVSDRGQGLAYLGMLTVDPALQGSGLGRALIDEAERMARDRFGADRMEMTVIIQRTELIDWYVRRGYALTGERRPFPAKDAKFGLPRREDLEFVVLGRKL